MALFGAIAFIPLLIQLTTGGSATSAGQILTPIYLMWVLASIVAARLLLRVGARAATVVGYGGGVPRRSSALPWLAVGSSRAALFADMGLMGTGLGFAMLSLLLAVQHSVSRAELGRGDVAQSVRAQHRRGGRRRDHGRHSFGRDGRIGIGSHPSDLEGAGLAGLSPELRQRLIASLQRAFGSGAVAAGLALVTSFWVPPFVGDGTVSSGQEMLGGEVSTVGSGTEPAA